MNNPPVFVTELSIARGKDFLIAAFSGPIGDFVPGTLQTGEVCRVVMSVSTLKAVTALLSATCAELDAAAAVIPENPIASAQVDFGPKMRRTN